jgi:ribosome recycling factor
MQDEMAKEIINEFKLDGNKAIDFLKSEFAVLKAGRANPKILDKVFVDYYGARTPLSQMANISAPEARMLVVSLWDMSSLNDVRKALQIADLGVSIADDGKVLRLIFPILTEERRKDLVKQVKKLAEEGKIAIRNLRKDTLDIFKTMKKDSEISEDGYAIYEKQVQKHTDDFNALIDELAISKEKEVMEV